MGRRIRVETSPLLTVSAVGKSTAFITLGADVAPHSWEYNAATKGIITPFIDGEIEKIVYDFNQNAAVGDSSTSIIGIRTRDTPHEWISVTTDWSMDGVTVYPLVEAKLMTNTSAKASNATNVYRKYVVHGSLLITCADAYSADSVKVKLYYR